MTHFVFSSSVIIFTFFIFCTSVYGSSDLPLAAYTKLQRICLPWSNPIARGGNGSCGTGYPYPCDLNELATNCSTTPGCNAFNTNGYMVHCPLGRCDCDSGYESCLRGLDIYSLDPNVNFGCDHADTYVLKGNDPPIDWVPLITTGKLLYGSPEASECFMPEIGNGYMSTTITHGALYVGGFFNGRCGTVGKARIPSPFAITLTNSTVFIGGGLDTVNGVYRRRYNVTTQNGQLIPIEQRWYMHRVHQNVGVMEIVPLASIANNDQLSLSYTSLWSPTGNGVVPVNGHIPGDGCAGGYPIDLDILSSSIDPSSEFMITNARTNSPGDDGELWNITLIVELYNMNGTITFTNNNGNIPAPLTFLTVVGTSLDTNLINQNGTTAAVESFTRTTYSQIRSIPASQLYMDHTNAWNTLNFGGIDILPNSTDPGDINRALDIATHISSAWYFLASSIRSDWFVGVSPGGISSGSYQGAVFMDMDIWMAPSLYLLTPSLAEAIVEFRYMSIVSGTEPEIATIFGYNGSMAAWTAGYNGRLFGCCSGHGSYEDCLEQHVNGAQAWAAWQYYAATGNLTWLANRGFTVLEGAADFHVSRVTPNADGSYSIKGVLPIDEWCVGSGCGCESPGVDDDAEMNAVTKVTLQKAAKAATLLGNTTVQSQLWQHIGDNLVILFNETNNHHNQFDSPTCPGGWGGSHYSSAHTVCPEDVMMLTYPFGEDLNTTMEVARADAEVFIPITCQENAGMTTPMHTIVWLQLGELALAEAEFNRSMHAACYGPYNVRNEVDVHPDIVGGHFNNSRFLTGDGGFLQAIVNGYGGIRILDDTLKLYQPILPMSVGEMNLRGLTWHNRYFNYTLGIESATISVYSTSPSGGLSIINAQGNCVTAVPGGSAVTLLYADNLWPRYISEQCT